MLKKAAAEVNGRGAAQVGASSTARRVAQHIKVRRPEAGSMKVMKLVYYAQAYALAWRGRRLFDDELEAWDKGPVVRSLWLDLKFRDRLSGAPLDAHDAALVDRMLDMYGDKSGAELSALTHAETPWREARGLAGCAGVSGHGTESAKAGVSVRAIAQPQASKRGGVISTKTMQEFYAAQWELVAPTSLPRDAAHVATSSSEAPTLRLTRLPCLRARSKQQKFHWHLHAKSAAGHP